MIAVDKAGHFNILFEEPLPNVAWLQTSIRDREFE